MTKLLLVSLVLATLSPSAFALDCSALRRTYEQLIEPVIPRNLDEAKRITPELVTNSRTRINELLERSISSWLTEAGSRSAEKIREDIRCVQVPARAEQENPSLPYVIALGDSRTPRFVIAYVVNAGGEGIPDSLPFMAVWTDESGRWRPHYLDMSFYLRSSFCVTPLLTEVGGQPRFLASGKEYGDTESRLKLLVFQIVGNRIDAVWRAFNFSAGSVKVVGSRIDIRYLPSRDSDIYKTLAYLVTRAGVEEVKR
jgi:hypothetical protein